MTAAPLRHLGLTFELNAGWMGGSYYIRNLICALGHLPPDRQPVITLLSGQADSVRFARETGYPRLGWLPIGDFRAAPEDVPFDLIFPWADPDQAYRTLSWIPDFQELHLRHYFTPAEIAARQGHHRRRFATAGLVVSSRDVAADVARFYPGECPDVAVVHFASFDDPDPARVVPARAQYGLTGRYVMVANQIWAHKNHILVLAALARLKAQGHPPLRLCLTGSESDYRVAGYADHLRARAADWGVADQVAFLGFIPRADQLALMKGADYVLQPSLFEGWSTVIEDAKAMGQVVAASDLAVHAEQLPVNGHFFARHDPGALARLMARLQAAPPRAVPVDYAVARAGFGTGFLAAAARVQPGVAGGRPRRISADALTRLGQDHLATLG
jgi:glycosyltransferase involved in cell wall biosynthesis